MLKEKEKLEKVAGRCLVVLADRELQCWNMAERTGRERQSEARHMRGPRIDIGIGMHKQILAHSKSIHDRQAVRRMAKVNGTQTKKADRQKCEE